jgi:hypothetical protein
VRLRERFAMETWKKELGEKAMILGIRKTVRETTPDGPLGFTYIRNVVLIAVHAFIMLWIHSTFTGFTGKLWRNGRIAIVHAI